MAHAVLDKYVHAYLAVGAISSLQHLVTLSTNSQSVVNRLQRLHSESKAVLLVSIAHYY